MLKDFSPCFHICLVQSCLSQVKLYETVYSLIWVLKLSVLKRTGKRLFIHPCMQTKSEIADLVAGTVLRANHWCRYFWWPFFSFFSLSKTCFELGTFKRGPNDGLGLSIFKSNYRRSSFDPFLQPAAKHTSLKKAPTGSHRPFYISTPAGAPLALADDISRRQ